ncbi:MAG: hypothetical protein A2Y10_19775 [Planctomycetes bacterium GWF2_41_51]|nr:MAG: hypothetical protein A2Y10_19775 [Planctomycetes bacterium GWF2_41_51]HBG28335.1 hypothetical protein [Phycisphaerales bacterium]
MKWFAQQKLKFKNTAEDCRRIYKSHTQQIFGLDIGTSAVKLVQLRKDENGYSLVAAETAYIEQTNETSELDRINTAIRKCVTSSKVNSRLAVCGVCGQETAVRNFVFPALLPEEIDGAVRFEAKQVCPFNSDDGVIDYQVISSSEKEVKGYLVVATNNIIKQKNTFVKKSSLDNVLMDFDGLALINCLRNCGDYEKGKTSAILNVGTSYATLVIISDDKLPFVRDLNYAGKEIIKYLAAQNDVAPEILEDYLRGKNPANIQVEINANLESACQKLINNVTETLYYDAVRRKSELVNKIYLCGGLALVNGFADLLKSKLPALTVLWNPFDKIQCDSSLPAFDALHAKGPAFAVAAGLAMRQI